MDQHEDVRLKEFLKRGAAPADSELRRDLWPAMLKRMEQSERRVPWFDWALLGLVGASLLLAPQIIPMLLYQL
ncbi:MAG TPA: hypothetical protein VJR23_14705 [Candidatus Acidoferrales bacterium]|nr:hypothetical protein [Candidatus Acidoferrales bacterium]